MNFQWEKGSVKWRCEHAQSRDFLAGQNAVHILLITSQLIDQCIVGPDGNYTSSLKVKFNLSIIDFVHVDIHDHGYRNKFFFNFNYMPSLFVNTCMLS